MPEHDDRCESEFIEGPNAATPCWCAERREPALKALGDALGHDPSDHEKRALEALVNAWDWDLDDMPLACRLVAALRVEGLICVNEGCRDKRQPDPTPDPAAKGRVGLRSAPCRLLGVPAEAVAA